MQPVENWRSHRYRTNLEIGDEKPFVCLRNLKEQIVFKVIEPIEIVYAER